MVDISHIDFSKHSPKLNFALVRLQAIYDLCKISKNDFEDSVLQLLCGTEDIRKTAFEKIEDWETENFGFRHKDYCKRVIDLITPERKKYLGDYPFGGNYHSGRKYSTKFIKIEDNKELTVDMAKKIVEQCRVDSSKVRGIELKNTIGLNKETLNILATISDFRMNVAGNQYFRVGYETPQACSIHEFKDMIATMERIEQGVNPAWSVKAKALYIYRAFYKNCKYARDNRMSSVFLEKQGMCQGFSQAFQEMMVRQNIPCHLVLAESTDHFFNEVQFDNKWYPIDAFHAVCSYNYGYNEEEFAKWTFAGKEFISHYNDEEKIHHRSSTDRFMNMEEGDDSLNYLTTKEYEAIAMEIKNNPKTVQKDDGKKVYKDSTYISEGEDLSHFNELVFEKTSPDRVEEIEIGSFVKFPKNVKFPDNVIIKGTIPDGVDLSGIKNLTLVDPAIGENVKLPESCTVAGTIYSDTDLSSIKNLCLGTKAGDRQKGATVVPRYRNVHIGKNVKLPDNIAVVDGARISYGDSDEINTPQVAEIIKNPGIVQKDDDKNTFTRRLCKYVRSGVGRRLPPRFKHWVGKVSVVNGNRALSKLYNRLEAEIVNKTKSLYDKYKGR